MPIAAGASIGYTPRMLPTVADLAHRHPWRPITGCPGRSSLPPTRLATLLEVDVDPPPMWTRAPDPVVALALPGGGGLLGYVKPDGGVLPTLCDEQGWRRKLDELGVPVPPDPAQGDPFVGDPRPTPDPGPLRPVPAGLVDLRGPDWPLEYAIAYATPDNFTGQPLPGYGAPGAWLAPAAAKALARAIGRLDEDGLRLRVYDAYRPVRATEAMYTWAVARGRRALFDDGWVVRRSQHNLGVAIDVGLVDSRTGADLPMGTPFDAFDAASQYAGVRGPPMERRALLRARMVEAGFTPTDLEWWHFACAGGDEQRRDHPYGRHEPPGLTPAR